MSSNAKCYFHSNDMLQCSADVTFARDRLAVLLQQIKKGDVVVPVVKEQKKCVCGVVVQFPSWWCSLWCSI